MIIPDFFEEKANASIEPKRVLTTETEVIEGPDDKEIEGSGAE